MEVGREISTQSDQYDSTVLIHNSTECRFALLEQMLQRQLNSDHGGTTTKKGNSFDESQLKRILQCALETVQSLYQVQTEIGEPQCHSKT